MGLHRGFNIEGQSGMPRDASCRDFWEKSTDMPEICDIEEQPRMGGDATISTYYRIRNPVLYPAELRGQLGDDELA
jgi:hypothetical protein